MRRGVMSLIAPCGVSRETKRGHKQCITESIGHEQGLCEWKVEFDDPLKWM